MPAFQAHLWRAAGQLQQLLRPENHDSVTSALICQTANTISDQQKLLQTTRQRGWSAAFTHLLQQLQSNLLRLQRRLQEFGSELVPYLDPHPPPTQAELYRELLDLQAEFATCKLDLRAGTLSVVTEPIVLESCELGPFRIVWDWKQTHSNNSPNYKVEALEPRCPDGRSQITHPHVMQGKLCEGDAQGALRLALQSGRLTDFFQIVNRTLHTYNSQSPYASLEDWEGVDCHACGMHTHHESEFCSTCRGYVCDGCSMSCWHCGTPGCDCCLSRCERCASGVCERCLNSCFECGQKVCPRCLNHNLCEDCHDQEQTTRLREDAEADADQHPPERPAIQPDGLVEVALSA